MFSIIIEKIVDSVVKFLGDHITERFKANLESAAKHEEHFSEEQASVAVEIYRRLARCRKLLRTAGLSTENTLKAKQAYNAFEDYRSENEVIFPPPLAKTIRECGDPIANALGWYELVAKTPSVAHSGEHNDHIIDCLNVAKRKFEELGDELHKLLRQGESTLPSVILNDVESSDDETSPDFRRENDEERRIM